MNGISEETTKKAYFHLPGLFEFYEFYKVFLSLLRTHREYFYDWCEIGSIYGAPEGCIWGGGRVGIGNVSPAKVKALLKEYGISPRLTFSNSLLGKEHLEDEVCNNLCRIFCGDDSGCVEHSNEQICADGNYDEQICADRNYDEQYAVGNLGMPVEPNKQSDAQAGVIVHSDLLAHYLKEKYPDLYLVSSTTKVQTDFEEFRKEINRSEFKYVVPDFRLNKSYEKLRLLSQKEKDKVEFLCNECCFFGCKDRRACYENVSRINLGEDCPDFECTASEHDGGYSFSKAMRNPGFISVEDIITRYMPMGFSNFKIEGRTLGSALLLEFILYYMVKPEYHIHVREELYLDNMLDLF